MQAREPKVEAACDKVNVSLVQKLLFPRIQFPMKQKYMGLGPDPQKKKAKAQQKGKKTKDVERPSLHQSELSCRNRIIATAAAFGASIE